MAKHKEEKTNVMRVLDQKKIPYTAHTYDPESGIDGVSVARSLGQDPAAVFKTLVARGASGGYYVFDIPVAATLDLKKAAHAVGEKSVAMLPQKELLPLTGYVHGGGEPVCHHGVGGEVGAPDRLRPQGTVGAGEGRYGGHHHGGMTDAATFDRRAQ